MNTTFREKLKNKKRIVIKIGSSSLTHPDTGFFLSAHCRKYFWIPDFFNLCFHDIAHIGYMPVFQIFSPDARFVSARCRMLDLNSSLGCAIASFKEPTLAKCTLIGFKSDL